VTPRRAPLQDRLLAAAGAAACIALLLVAAALTPSDEGLGTHTDLGMPECGWITAFEKPCLTCGMTTSFSHAADGQFLAAAAAQPAGALLAVAAAAGFWTCLHAALFGSRIARLFATLWRPRFIIAGAAILLLAWFYKLAVWTP
jgi:hypothetical protein